MAAGLTADPKPEETKAFGSLRIRQRVLETPSKSISIRNIAAVSVGTIQGARNRLPLLIGVALAVVGIVVIAGSGAFTTTPSQVSNHTAIAIGILLLFLGPMIAALAITPADLTHYLIISSNDGSRALFTGPKREMLDEVRQLLAEKINDGDERATYNVNFQNGTIENLTVDRMSAGALVQGDNNQLAVNSAHARVGSAGDNISVKGSAGVQIGSGHNASGATNSLSVINYADETRRLEPVRDYCAQNGWGDVTAKLDEMLQLMRQGTPYPQQKSRLAGLVGELRSVFSTSAELVALLQQIARMAGF